MKVGTQMGISLNQLVKPQAKELNRKAKIFSDINSPEKRLYVEGHKPHFSSQDIMTLIISLRKIYKLPLTLNRTVKLIKRDCSTQKSLITKQEFGQLIQLLTELQVDDFGFFEVTPERIFRSCGVPYKYALVFSSAMDNKAFENAPCIECQLEVAKVYATTGNIANRVSEFLQKNGFGASPNHSMGGQLDYSMAAEWAGIAVTGRHSMAITKNNGACNRLSVVYTNIENLKEFIMNTEDMTWIRGFCDKCGKCIRKCPKGAIYENPVILNGINPTRIDYVKCCEGFLEYGCGVCIMECPFTAGNYEKTKKAFFKE